MSWREVLCVYKVCLINLGVVSPAAMSIASSLSVKLFEHLPSHSFLRPSVSLRPADRLPAALLAVRCGGGRSSARGHTNHL